MRDETLMERADRNYNELLQELRVAQTGIQILFAFLLTIPFQQRFAEEVGTDLRLVYLVTLLAAAAASVFLIGPVSHHRILFQQGRKPSLVITADVLAKCGLACLALSMTGAVFLVVAVVSARDTASWFAGGLALLFLLIWLIQPLRLRARGRAGDAGHGGPGDEYPR
jgi:O-antigen/teichoic acid export membrane protein